MKTIKNIIDSELNINESALQAKDTVYDTAKSCGFDFNKTADEINKNQDWYVRRSDRMSNAAGMKYLDTLRELTSDEDAFNKLINARRKKEEKTNKAIAAKKEASDKIKREALENLLKLGNESLTVILDENGKRVEYKLTVDNDFNIILKK
jgi:hypothetical protein